MKTRKHKNSIILKDVWNFQGLHEAKNYVIKMLWVKRDSQNDCNKYGNLPLEEDKIISGYLGFVAICVTQPLCPKRVPFNCRVSAIF